MVPELRGLFSHPWCQLLALSPASSARPRHRAADPWLGHCPRTAAGIGLCQQGLWERAPCPGRPPLRPTPVTRGCAPIPESPQRLPPTAGKPLCKEETQQGKYRKKSDHCPGVKGPRCMPRGPPHHHGNNSVALSLASQCSEYFHTVSHPIRVKKQAQRGEVTGSGIHGESVGLEPR